MSTDHDPQVIARLRSALDEVAAVPAVAVSAPHRPTMSARRGLAAAACVVLVAGAVTALAMNRGDRHSVSPAGPTESTAPTTASTGNELTMPYFLAAQDLAPGPVETTGATPADGTLLMAWVRNGDMADGVLFMSAAVLDASLPTTTSADWFTLVIDGTQLRFASYGLSAAERDVLAAQVIPGSGLPWLLPVGGWTMVAMQTPSDGPTKWQTFGGSVILTIGPLAIGTLEQFAVADTITTVTVAGQPGWQIAADDSTVVMWREPNSGQWASLTVPPSLADRVDGLIAAIVPTGDNGATASTVPTPEPWVGEVSLEMAVSSYALAPYDPSTLDPAVGQPIPTIRLVDGEFTVDTPTLFVFAAHWCPHCASEIPVLQQAVADGSFGATRVVIVLTGADLDRTQQAEWLAGLGWTGDVLYDTSSGDRSPGLMAGYFGVNGYPSFVMVDADGMVAGRATGETAVTDLATLTDISGAKQRAAEATVVGELEIAGIGVDFFVVDGNGALDQAARLGPVLVDSALPTTLRSQPASDPVSVVVFGHRATYGSPFLRLAELKAGDRIVWTDTSGTATFEVITATTCVAATIADCPPASGQDQLVLLTQDPDVTTQGWLMVTARRIG